MRSANVLATVRILQAFSKNGLTLVGKLAA
jgi:hypothetical protein